MKFALKSRTVLASLVVIAAMIALVLSDAGAIVLEDGTRQLLQALAGAGGALSIYGRVQADGPLTMKPGVSRD